MPQIREGLQNVAQIGLAPGAMAAGPSVYNASTPPPPPPPKKNSEFLPWVENSDF